MQRCTITVIVVKLVESITSDSAADRTIPSRTDRNRDTKTSYFLWEPRMWIINSFFRFFVSGAFRSCSRWILSAFRLFIYLSRLVRCHNLYFRWFVFNSYAMIAKFLSDCRLPHSHRFFPLLYVFPFFLFPRVRVHVSKKILYQWLKRRNTCAGKEI